MTVAAVAVRVPATSANLGPGFDSMGLALGLHDELAVEVADGPGATVQVDGEGAGTVPADERNLVVRAMHETFAELGRPAPGLRLRCRNRIPHGRGLGSSAAAIVAGVAAARAIAGGGEDRSAVLRTAARIEGHPDNVAAAVLGGLALAWSDADGFRAVHLDVAPTVRPVLLVPEGSLSTEAARAMLPASVSHGDASFNAGRAALLVAALTQRADLLLAATEDRLHQSQRAPAMPATWELVASLRERGQAAVVSGAGPSVLVLVQDASAVPAPDGWRRFDVGVDGAGLQVEIRG